MNCDIHSCDSDGFAGRHLPRAHRVRRLDAPPLVYAVTQVCEEHGIRVVRTMRFKAASYNASPQSRTLYLALENLGGSRQVRL